MVNFTPVQNSNQGYEQQFSSHGNARRLCGGAPTSVQRGCAPGRHSGHHAWRVYPLSLLGFDAFGVSVNFATIATFGLFAFYLTLDRWFSVAFLAYAIPIAWLATVIGNDPTANTWMIAGATFVGGYIAQFIGHAVEKSVPVLLKHPIQANLAAPFFTVVEIFGLLGLREHLFDQVQREVALAREQQTA